MEGLGEDLGDYLDDLGHVLETPGGATKAPSNEKYFAYLTSQSQFKGVSSNLLKRFDRRSFNSKFFWDETSTVGPLSVESQNVLDYSNMAWITSGCIVGVLLLTMVLFILKGISKRRIPQIPTDEDCDIPFEKII